MIAAPPHQMITALFGPTASGKTSAAMEIARRAGGEIVSVDSGQIYRGLDIGTAKPTTTERARVPFHLIDVVDPVLKFSAAMFREKAIGAIADIRSRGKLPILTVGTGLYFRALEEGVFEAPPVDLSLRDELERRVREKGIAALEAELRRIDPEAAQSIPKNNRQRVIRALEVHRLTGRPISEHWRSHGRGKGKGIFHFQKLGVNPSKAELDRRIEERVEEMIEQGLIAEVRQLLERWGDEAPGLKLIGYKEIVAYLKEKSSLEAAIASIVRNTRQYAKRQRTWFKKDREIQWFEDADTLTQCLTKK